MPPYMQEGGKMAETEGGIDSNRKSILLLCWGDGRGKKEELMKKDQKGGNKELKCTKDGWDEKKRRGG